MQKLDLGVNIDHIATLRQARQITEPDPMQALSILKQAGAHQVTIHLREDRRHIQDFDVCEIMQHSSLPVNIECANDPKIIDLICAKRPFKATLVPEKREEVTTEGGLDMTNPALNLTIAMLKNSKIKVATFINPDEKSIKLSKDLGADGIELHTGTYANLYLALNEQNLSHLNLLKDLTNLDRLELETRLKDEIDSLKNAAKFAKSLGLEVYAGHGLNANNLDPIAKIKEISELNIGHSIIARSIFVGLKDAIKEILDSMQRARNS